MLMGMLTGMLREMPPGMGLSRVTSRAWPPSFLNGSVGLEPTRRDRLGMQEGRAEEGRLERGGALLPFSTMRDYSDVIHG